MIDLDFLVAINPRTSRSDVAGRIKHRKTPGYADATAPISGSLRTGGDVRIGALVEFDSHGVVAFAETDVKCSGLDDALVQFRQLEAQIIRADCIVRDAARQPPIRRSAIPLQQLHAWNRWELGDDRSLQIIVGAFKQPRPGTEQVRLAASLHIGADRHAYGPKPGDVSTAQAPGWDDFFRLSPPDLVGRVTLIRDSTATIERKEPGLYGPGSTFRIFR